MNPIYERLIRGILMGLCVTGTYVHVRVSKIMKKDIHNFMNKD